MKNVLLYFSRTNLLYMLLFLVGADVALFVNESNNLKVEYLGDLYYIQEDFANNRFEDSLIGDNLHIGLFDLANKDNRCSNLETLHLYIGICLCKLKHYEEGIKHLKSVRVTDKFLNAKISTLIGDCYTDLGEYDNALENFFKAAELVKESKEAMSNIVYKIVLIYEEKKMYKEALDLLKKTIRKFKSEGNISILDDEKKKIKLLQKKLIHNN